MKTIKRSLAVTFIMLICVSCNLVGGVRPSDNYITRNYKVVQFDKMNLSTVGDVFFTQTTDGTTSVKIYGPDNILDLIEVSVENSELFITFKEKSQVKNIDKLEINISSPELKSVAFHGVGTVTLGDKLLTEELLIHKKGVGNLYAQGLDCRKLIVKSEGVGETNLAGTAMDVELSNSGVGNLNASGLEANSVDVTSRGVGNVTCWATNNLSAKTHGIGSIIYKGNPKSKDILSKGMGSISGM